MGPGGGCGGGGAGWEGGFSFGPRYLIPAIPFVMLLAARFSMRMAVVWSILGAISIAICFTATAVDPHPSGTIPRALTQYIYPLLVRGEFSPDVPITPPWSAETIRGHVAVNPPPPDQCDGHHLELLVRFSREVPRFICD